MKIHIVKKGDSLYEIAKKNQVELDKLIAANPQIADPDKIEVGEKVKIPLANKPIPAPPSDYVHKHVVVQGDTLWKLSKKWNIPLKAIIDANPHIKNPSVLMTGDIVYIPNLTAGDPHMTDPDMHIHNDPKGTAPINENPKGTAPINENPKGTAPITPPPVMEEPNENPPINEAPAELPPANEAPVELPPVNEKPVELPPVNEEPKLEAPVEEKPVQPVPEQKKPEKTEKETPMQLPYTFPQAVQQEEPLYMQMPIFDMDLGAPKKEKGEKGHKSPCPPLPNMTVHHSDVHAYPYMQMPQFDPNYQPYAQHPFQQYQVPAAEAYAPYGHYGFGAEQPSLQAEAAQLPNAWANQPLPQIPGMPPQSYPSGFPSFEAPQKLPDCGCGSGGVATGLPYALPQFQQPQSYMNEFGAPYSGAVPYGTEPLSAAAPSMFPYMGNVQPDVHANAMPYSQQPFSYPNPHDCYAAPGYPGGIFPGFYPRQEIPYYPGAGVPTDYYYTQSTPYINYYPTPGVDPFSAPHSAVNPEGAERSAQDEVTVNSAAAEKTSDKKNTESAAKSTPSSSGGKGKNSERAALHAFLNSKKEKSNSKRTAKDNVPWVKI